MKKTGLITFICLLASFLCACACNETDADMDVNIQNESMASESMDKTSTSYQVSRQEKVFDSDWVSEEFYDSIDTLWMQKDPVSIQVLKPEDVEVMPEIIEYDYDSVCKMGEICQMRGILPGMSEGTWYTITVDGVEYYYVRYDDFPDRTELIGYAIISVEYSLADGISVGMTKKEVIERCPAMAILDTEGNTLNEVIGYMGWNPAVYPYSPAGMDEKLEYIDEEDYYWVNQFDYIMIADVEQTPDTLPLYMALMMKDDTVSAITFYNPTAG